MVSVRYLLGIASGVVLGYCTGMQPDDSVINETRPILGIGANKATIEL